MQRSRIPSPIVAVLAVLTVLFVLSPLSADTLTFTLDPAATTIELHFGATLHSVDGTLRAKQGTVELDPATGQASGRIVLDATSAQTGNGRRDQKMHAKILESAKYPEMVFTVERVSGVINLAGRSELELHGSLDMHGVKRPIDVVATAKTEGNRVTATGRVTIPYLEWGIADPSFFVLRVEKEVHVEIKAAGRLASSSAAPSAQ
jgi:polyisoprenoid-binding protein YceI